MWRTYCQCSKITLFTNCTENKFTNSLFFASGFNRTALEGQAVLFKLYYCMFFGDGIFACKIEKNDFFLQFSNWYYFEEQKFILKPITNFLPYSIALSCLSVSKKRRKFGQTHGILSLFKNTFVWEQTANFSLCFLSYFHVIGQMEVAHFTKHLLIGVNRQRDKIVKVFREK